MYTKLIAVVLLFLFALPLYSQEQEHPPQILYRKDGKLFLADATTGSTTAFPGIETTQQDSWYWSPDGRYLLGLLKHEAPGSDSLKIYDVLENGYVTNLPLIEAARGETLDAAAWSPDSAQFSYARNRRDGNGDLWIVNLADGKQTLLEQTVPTNQPALETGIGAQWWSPDGEHLLFAQFEEFTGGENVSLNLKTLRTGERIPLYERVYALYAPHWSPNSAWFSLILRDNYREERDIVNRDLGDIFLYNAADETQYRVTNTPEVEEKNLRWSDGETLQYEVGSQLLTVNRQDIVNATGTNIPAQISTLPASPLEAIRANFGISPTYSPNRDFIAYGSLDGASYNLWVVDTGFQQYRKIDALNSIIIDVLGWRP